MRFPWSTETVDTFFHPTISPPKKSSSAGHGGFQESISRLQMLAFEAQAIGRAGMPTVEPVELEHEIPSGKLIREKLPNTAT